MMFRERLFEELAGDLEYHPKRGLVYLAFGAGALCYWIFPPSSTRSDIVPLLFGLGSITLLLKGVLLLRKTSEGLGLTQRELDQLSDPSTRKSLPPIPTMAAQLVQDFGAGALLLGPFLHALENIDEPSKLPSFPVFLAGGIIFFIGWLFRRLTSSDRASIG